MIRLHPVWGRGVHRTFSQGPQCLPGPAGTVKRETAYLAAGATKGTGGVLEGLHQICID